MGKKEKKIDYQKVVKNRKIPIFTIDTRWHELFPEGEKPSEIKDLEQKVNNLLKKQGKLGDDIKAMKKLKNNLMKEIMANMDITNNELGKAKERKMDKNKQLIEEINEKITVAMDELSDIPYQIKEVNETLAAASIEICYQRLEQQKKMIDEIAEWIAKVRGELKDKILLKQDMEDKNTLIYSYLHDLLGADLMEAFDRENNS